MKTVEINKTNALKAYKEADKKGKELLENLLGKEVLSEKITDRIKTFEDACIELGAPSHNLKIFLDYPGTDEDMIGAQALAKLSIIVRALNEGWKPDWNNSNELKYYPIFEANKTGFGFSRSRYDDWITRTYCGSRLCFKSSELAEYAGKQFIEIYNQLLTIK